MIQNSNSLGRAFVALLALTLLVFGVTQSLAQNPKRSEQYFMTRAERSSKLSCAHHKRPTRTSKCLKAQMAAARRIVSYIRRGDKKRRLKRTLSCLQKVQVLPRRLRRRGLLWVESCSK